MNCSACKKDSTSCHYIEGEYYCDPCSDALIFVFGSNLAGRHGSGAALHAKLYKGAVYGVGVGRTGNAYAIPTKGPEKEGTLSILTLEEIRPHVNDYIEYAKQNLELKFQLTRIGCGFAGYTNKDMAPMFKGVPSNVIIPKDWRLYLL